MTYYEELMQKIVSKTIKIGIIGLGYVGLPLAVAFARKGVKVLGFEKNEEKAGAVNASQNYITDIVDAELVKVVAETQRLYATTDFSRIRECDALIICVPTPLDKFKKPDMSYIENACINIGKNMKTGIFISLESNTYPTTTGDTVKITD
jgi:UDP-N-acetyl-D-glucosamine dehydrogenase